MPSLADDLRTAPTTVRPFRPDPVRPAATRRAAERARLEDTGGTRVLSAEPELRALLDLGEDVVVVGVLVARPRR